MNSAVVQTMEWIVGSSMVNHNIGIACLVHTAGKSIEMVKNEWNVKMQEKKTAHFCAAHTKMQKIVSTKLICCRLYPNNSMHL